MKAHFIQMLWFNVAVFNLDCGGSALEWQRRAQVAGRLTASQQIYPTTAYRFGNAVLI